MEFFHRPKPLVNFPETRFGSASANSTSSAAIAVEPTTATFQLAPVHLAKTVGRDSPIAYALDGHPNHGYEELDEAKIKGLDAFNGHKDKNGNDHYHATKKYPYLNGGFFSEADCTCNGASQPPAVEWKDSPKGTKSFAVGLWHTAPDQEKSYWGVYNIPANVMKLAKNGHGVGTLGLNDRRRAEYDPMCSKGPGVKTYRITVFALSAEQIPNLPSNKDNRAGLLAAIKDITLAEGTLDFQYERKK